MRIIHTSDWHFGQNFYSKSRAAEHSAFLDWLLTSAQAHEVDAIIVAGDIFDTGSPPSYARELYNRFVVQLQQTGCQLVVLAGNHDSVATLNESRDILAFLKTTVVASAGHAPFILPQRDGTPGAIFCPVPFLRPRELVTSQAGHSGGEKQQLLLNAISDYYQQQYEAACALRGDRPLPIVASGHLTTVGASKSDAVRDIYIGTLEAFPASHFPPVDYVALGHIHRAQKIGGSDHIRYSGSPIALSFDETGKSKSVNLVTFSDGHLAEVLPLTVPVTQPLAVLKGDFSSISEQLTQWRDAPQEPVVWLDIEITSDEYLHDIQRKIQAQTEDLPVEVLLVRRSRAQRERILAGERRETLSELQVEEVFERRLAQETLEEAQRLRLTQLFNETLHSLNGEEHL
ncbi:exonuclease subunit SbcD [Raoultella ornithinolytica]|uniref:exonuclease subunit SbcD n=1 Tax=Raoultella ornithinolytica TaxID=54291 RepID=UPI0015DCA2C1|nr:exonuclease subunit SbcD [Raoultella ornithinolytica]QLK23041.1 exonuclease subunit SbcD [Raoultella ornithinolytica]HAU5006263.1 exonuclease subunit SbcD [Raoultella ornithinolytica]